MKATHVIATALLVFAAAAAPVIEAQAPAIKRTVLQRFDLGDGKEVIVGLAEVAAGTSIGRHTHFGVETGYTLEGSASLEVEGEMPKLLKAGDSYFIPDGKVHDAKVVGDKPAKVLAIYIVEKGKPLATPAK